MKKYKIITIPLDRPIIVGDVKEYIWKQSNGLYSISKEVYKSRDVNEPVQLLITLEDEIKKGDWYTYDNRNPEKCDTKEVEENIAMMRTSDTYKIIASHPTIDSLPLIHTNDLQYFVDELNAGRDDVELEEMTVDNCASCEAFNDCFDNNKGKECKKSIEVVTIKRQEEKKEPAVGEEKSCETCVLCTILDDKNGRSSICLLEAPEFEFGKCDKYQEDDKYYQSFKAGYKAAQISNNSGLTDSFILSYVKRLRNIKRLTDKDIVEILFAFHNDVKVTKQQPNDAVELPNGYNLKLLARLLKYCNKYDISIQFWTEQTAVYIEKDGIALTDFGGDFDFAVTKAIEYLDRITKKK